EVRLLPARFAKAYEDFRGCTAKLLPVNFDQIRKTQIGFPSSDVTLDARGQAKLDIILQYLKADPTVNRIQLDGHSDNSGNRLSNRDLSRRRALAVEEYLLANGVPKEQITLRFHGERYPLVPNRDAASRAKNRRVGLSLYREPASTTAAVEHVDSSSCGEIQGQTRPSPCKPNVASSRITGLPVLPVELTACRTLIRWFWPIPGAWIPR